MQRRRYRYSNCGQFRTMTFSPSSPMAQQSVRSRYCSNSRRGGSNPGTKLMVVICEQPIEIENTQHKIHIIMRHYSASTSNLPVMSRCCRFEHLVTKSNSVLLLIGLYCTCRWVSSGQRREMSCSPLSLMRQPLLSMTRSTSAQVPFRVCPQSRRKMALSALSPMMCSPM